MAWLQTNSVRGPLVEQDGVLAKMSNSGHTTLLIGLIIQQQTIFVTKDCSTAKNTLLKTPTVAIEGLEPTFCWFGMLRIEMAAGLLIPTKR